MAATKTTMMATSACWAWPLTRALAMPGQIDAPTAAPPSEAGEAEHADDEALPVPGDGEG